MQTPTTQEIADNIVAQLEATLAQSVPLLPKSFSRVLAKALAGVFLLVYKYAGFMLLQMFVAHATDKETLVNGKLIRPLVEWGRLIGVGDPLDATRAEHVIAVTVTSQTGNLEAGTQVLRSETGVIYQVVADVPLDAPIVYPTIRAASDQLGGGGEGSIGNLSPSDVVSFANPLSNVASDATISSTTVTGADAEPTETYRARIIRRFQRRPQGGAYADYQEWGEAVPGIVNVYPYTGAPGVVDVFAEATIASSGSADGIPTLAQQAAVEAAINLDVAGRATRRPVNVLVNVEPIVRVSFSVTVTNLEPDTPDIRAAIRLGVDEYLRSREPYIEGLSNLPREDRVTQAAVSGIVDTIVNAEGGTVTSVEITPGPGYTLDRGEKAKLGGDVDYI